jgi:RNA methyltransferase, TrmH family
MISKNQLAFLRSLQQKKIRQQQGLFLVEGAKSVQEVLASDFGIERLICTDQFYKENARLTDHQRIVPEIVTPDDLTRAGTLETNDAAIAVARMRPNDPLRADPGEWALVLDDIRDPGNLGTILRVADWYGIANIVCSPTTADVYNPKVISASKGSFTRVRWFYTDLARFFSDIGAFTPSHNHSLICGAFLDGENVHRAAFGARPDLARPAYLVMGNESTGIGPAVAQYVTHKLTIPRFGGAESLNVGVATAVLLDNLRRSQSR